MPDTFRIFVNERPISIGPGQSLRDVVGREDEILGLALEEGRAQVTDGVGRAIDAHVVPKPGDIFRVFRSAKTRRATD